MDEVQQFKLYRKITQGNQSTVYQAQDRETGRRVALKISQDLNAHTKEVFLLKQLNSRFFPELIKSGSEQNNHFIALELLQNSLPDKITAGMEWSSNQTYRLGITLLKALQNLHELGYVHNDIKPSNIGLTQTLLPNFKLFDLGFATQFKSSDSKLLKRKKEKFRGNDALASVNLMKKKSTAPRDDLMSLSYLMAYLQKGSLPWLNYRSFKEIIVAKESSTAQVICQGLEQPVKQFCEYCLKLKFLDDPNYEEWVQIFANQIEASSSLGNSRLLLQSIEGYVNDDRPIRFSKQESIREFIQRRKAIRYQQQEDQQEPSKRARHV